MDSLEKRKHPRAPVNITLKIESLYKETPDILGGIDQNIIVRDISKSGIKFFAAKELPIGYYFNAKITIDDEKYFFSVLKIIRTEKVDDGYEFGCEFVGLADVLSGCIDGLF